MIPVFQPAIGEDEINAVVDTLRRGEISGTSGQTISDFEKEFAEYCGCKYGVAVSSGTTALHLAVAASGIKRGDQILVSALTNISTALAAYNNNAIPVPVDSEEFTWNLDLDLIEKNINERTKAIIPVHIYGHPVDMDKLCHICHKHNLVIIEDCAESHGAECRGKITGSFGDMGCFSFYANKIITTGEGGMITTNNYQLSEKLKLLRNLAFTKPRFRHEYAGYNFRMTALQAAMGLVQVKKINKIIEDKRRVANLYNKYLNDVPELKLPPEEQWAKNVYWMYGVVINDNNKINRDHLIDWLYNNGIDTRTFFCPINIQPCFKSHPEIYGVSCPVAEKLWRKGFYLPSSTNLSEETIKQISLTIKSGLKYLK